MPLSVSRYCALCLLAAFAAGALPLCKASRPWGFGPGHALPQEDAPPQVRPLPSPAGQFLRVRGPVSVRRGVQRFAATTLDQVRADDLVSVGAGGEATVILYGKRSRARLMPQSTVRVTLAALNRVSGPAPLVQAVSHHLIPDADWDTRFGPRHGGLVEGGAPNLKETARTDKPRVEILAPRGALRRAGDLVARWRIVGAGKSVGGASELTEVELTVWRDDAPPLVLSARVPGESWTPTTSEQAQMLPGSQCLLRVRRAQMAWATSRIFILTDAARQEVEAAETDAETLRRATPLDSGPDLLLARLYETARLYPDACAAYRRALTLTPDDSGIKSALSRIETVTKP